MKDKGMEMLKRWASYVVEFYNDNNEAAAKRWWLYLRGAVEMYFTLKGDYVYMTPESYLIALLNEACEANGVPYEVVCDFVTKR